jgi:hypothetical protein
MRIPGFIAQTFGYCSDESWHSNIQDNLYLLSSQLVATRLLDPLNVSIDLTIGSHVTLLHSVHHCADNRMGIEHVARDAKIPYTFGDLVGGRLLSLLLGSCVNHLQPFLNFSLQPIWRRNR